MRFEVSPHVLVVAVGWCCVLIVEGDLARGEDNDALRTMLRDHQYAMSLKGDRVGGPAVEFIVAQTHGAQFVGFAEPHNLSEVPRLFTGIFRELHAAHGFNYVALETGPLIAERMSEPPVRGDLEAMRELYFRFPRSFHFYTDEEIAMMVEVGKISDAPSMPLWGVDQMHGAAVAVDELIRITDDAERRDRLEALRTKLEQVNAADILNRRGFIKAEGSAIPQLGEWYAPEAGSRAEWLIDQLTLSHRVYRNNIDASGGAATGYVSNVEREENMKSLFLRYYRRAKEADGRPAKVFVKQGHWHLMGGRSPGNAYPLGSFLREFAKSNGWEFFNIGVSYNSDAKGMYSLADDPDFAPVSELTDAEGATLFDLRPLRGYAHAGQLAGLSPNLRSWLFDYDAVLIIGNAKRGGYDTSRERSRRQRRAVSR